jgi:hypothetical protein
VVQIVEEEDVDDVMAGYECWGCALAAKLRLTDCNLLYVTCYDVPGDEMI